MAADHRIYFSKDNGQMACAAHKYQYGRIPWRLMPPVEVLSMMRALTDCKPFGESLCEICSKPARDARYAARHATASP
jgi:hypothetical protein